MVAAAAGKERKPKRRVKKNVPEGVAHVAATFNNTIITISDMEGNVVAWASAGGSGFKGSKKGTSFAAQVAAGTSARVAKDNGMRMVDVRVKGPGAGLQMRSILDVTPVPHNGCRPYKRRPV